MASKTKKQPVSLFGINDCHKPKNNTKKNTNTGFVKFINDQKH